MDRDTQAVRDTQLLWIPAAGLESLALSAPRAFVSMVWRMGARSSGGGGGGRADGGRGGGGGDMGGVDFAGMGSAAGIQSGGPYGPSGGTSGGASFSVGLHKLNPVDP